MKFGKQDDLKAFLDQKVLQYNQVRFIVKDPISIPHQYTVKQDIEIAGFFAAILSWGNRTSIITNANRIMQAMDGAPYDFIRSHQETDLKKFLAIQHRTFQTTDLLYFIEFLSYHYQTHDSLEFAFCPEGPTTMRERLIYFQNYFFSIEHPKRTRKHISSPLKNSACKRINMFLRWMVRKDQQGVDFGIWNRIPMHELICPLDIHVIQVANRLGLLDSLQSNWKNAMLLTTQLKAFDDKDPCRYDFALFGLGAEERMR